MLFRKLNIRETVATCLPIRLLHHYLGLYPNLHRRHGHNRQAEDGMRL
jgi:hypothetical protein